MKNMANILGTLQHARETPVEQELVPPEAAVGPIASMPATTKKETGSRTKVQTLANPTKTVGKSSNPDFEPVKVLLRKTTRKQAERKWNDATEQDFSDLVEHLLSEYLHK